MQKQCKCGRKMLVRLRTVVYQSKLEIENVPVFTCENCQHSEVFSAVREPLAGLVQQSKASREKIRLRLDELNEWAFIIKKAVRRDPFLQHIEGMLEERINELLDLLILARSLHAYEWAEEIQRRLAQITSYTFSV